jgi:putative aldouronate transport system substrate-binding protein
MVDDIDTLTSGNNYADLAARDITGVSIEWLMFSNVIATDQFNIIIAGGEYPDIIDGFTSLNAKAGRGGIADEIIIDLNNYVDYMPNYMAIRNADEDVYKSTMTDNGEQPCFYWFTELGDGPMAGMYVRQDWLDKLNISAPKTLDDMESMLLAIKTEFDPKYPLYLTSDGVLMNNNLAAAYGINALFGMGGYPMYQVDGEVQFGMWGQDYRDYLTMMNSWYNEGIIHSDFTSVNSSPFSNDLVSDIASSNAGVWVYFVKQDDTWDNLCDDPDFNAVAIADVGKTEDQVLEIGNLLSTVSNAGVAISTSCKYPELAVQWCDFWYTDEGILLANYGIEGETYEFDSAGNPQHTDDFLNPPEGTTLQSLQYIWTLPMMSTVYQSDRTTQGVNTDRATWGSNKNGNRDISSFITMTAEENSEFAQIMSDVQTYCTESILAFINGTKSLDDSSWADYEATISKMNIDDAIQIYQQAYDRYLAR